MTGTSSDALSGISGVKVNNVAATSSNNFATWSATVPLGFGTNAITATATDGAGNLATTAETLVTLTTAQTYNPLLIPDVLTGTTFDLTLAQKTKQGLIKLIDGFAKQTTPYRSRPRVLSVKTYGEYDRLARRGAGARGKEAVLPAALVAEGEADHVGGSEVERVRPAPVPVGDERHRRGGGRRVLLLKQFFGRRCSGHRHSLVHIPPP